MRINENILISSLTTMRLGGPARYVLEIEKPEEIPDAYGFAHQFNLPTFVLGAGANTIGHDEGFPGVIIINRIRGIIEESVSWAGGRAGGSPMESLDDMGEAASQLQLKIILCTNLICFDSPTLSCGSKLILLCLPLFFST